MPGLLQGYWGFELVLAKQAILPTEPSPQPSNILVSSIAPCSFESCATVLKLREHILLKILARLSDTCNPSIEKLRQGCKFIASSRLSEPHSKTLSPQTKG